MNRSLLTLVALCLTLSPLAASAYEEKPLVPIDQTDVIKDLAKTLAESRASYNRRLFDDCVYFTKEKSAAEKDVQEIAADLLASRLDPRHTEAYGETILHVLARRGTERSNPNETENQHKLCEQLGLALVAMGADPNRRDNAGWTPLQLAALVPEQLSDGQWRASKLYAAMAAAGGDENAIGAGGSSAKQLLIGGIELRKNQRPLTQDELCQMDQMSCR